MSVSRRSLLTALGAGAAVAIGAGVGLRTLTPPAPPAPAPARSRAARRAGGDPPNVLFLFVDDLRPELGCYGRPLAHAPNIDALAASALRFQRAYCQQAVCTPSRASVLSGCRPDTTGVTRLSQHLRETMPDAWTLPQQFRANGYTALSLGKVFHNGILDDPQSWSQKPWAPGRADDRDYVDPASIALFKDYVRQVGRKKAKGRGPVSEDPDVPDDAYRDGKVANQTIQSLRRLKKAGKPFFLASGFYKPHLPFNAPLRYWELFDRASLPLAPNPFPAKGCPTYALTDSGDVRAFADVPKEADFDEALCRRLVHGYYAATAYSDAQVGAVLSELADLGLDEDTVVVLLGDHGWHLGEQGIWSKHTNFEVGTRTPLLIRQPGGRQGGQASDALVELVDIYPTLCDLCGISRPEHLEGSSVAPLFEDPKQPWKVAAFSQFPRSGFLGRTARTDRYRYTVWKGRKGQVDAVELYDHQEDPNETVNVAEEARYADAVRELQGVLDRGWQAVQPA